MKKRELVICIILTIVTFGIYGIYWFFCLHNDTQRVASEEGTSAIVAFLLSIVTCGIYSFYWIYRRGQLRGRNESDKAVVYLILSIVGLSIIAYALMQNEINKIIDIDNGVA